MSIELLDQLQNAQDCLAQGDINAVAEVYRRMLNNDHEHLEAQVGINSLFPEDWARRPFSERFQHVVQLCKQRQFHLAQEHASILVKEFPNKAIIFALLGRVKAELGLFQDAVDNFNNAFRLKPYYAQAYNDLGLYYQMRGDHANALDNLNKAIHHKPDFAAAYRNLSVFKEFEQGDPLFERMANILSLENISVDDRIHLNFALGKAHEDVASFSIALEHFQAGNKLRSEQAGYDFSRDAERYMRIRSLFQGRIPRLLSREFSCDTTPIFILGMPRSGSTLVEQILASHSLVKGGGELPLLGKAIGDLQLKGRVLQREHMLKIRESYLSSVKKISPKTSFVTDKMPHNFLWIGFMLCALPEAKIIHVKRDARATCWSIFKHYLSNKENGFTHSLDDIVKYYKMYSALMEFWRTQFPNQIYELSYEDLTEHPEVKTRDVLNHIGLDWDPRCMEFYTSTQPVLTASSAQVRRGIYSDSSAQWKNYQPFTQAMEVELADF